MAKHTQPGTPDQGPRKFPEAEHVAALVPDPSQPPTDLKMLFGFLGRSSRAGCVRLYINPELTDYYDLRDEDIVHSRRPDAAQSASPLDGTYLWVKKDAQLIHTRTESGEPQASFLEGDITRSFLSGGGGLGAGQLSPVAVGPSIIVTSVITVSLVTVALCTGPANTARSVCPNCPILTREATLPVQGCCF